MSQKWVKLREFLVTMMEKLDRNELELHELLFLNNCKRNCEAGRESCEYTADDVQRIITLGLVADFALSENKASSQNKFSSINEQD
jgi:hypothetical protein